MERKQLFKQLAVARIKYRNANPPVSVSPVSSDRKLTSSLATLAEAEERYKS
jgi:hypothetical protein